MAGTVVPFTFVSGKSDTSDLRTLTRPLRVMSAREEWVYDQLVVDWAELDGLTQKALYALGCIGKFDRYVAEVFKQNVSEVGEDVDRTSQKYGARLAAVSKRDYIAGTADVPLIVGAFDKALVDSTATTLLRLHAAVGHELGRVASRSLDPPSGAELTPRVRRGFWQRLLDV